MSIQYTEQSDNGREKCHFVLSTPDSSYVISVLSNGFVAHEGWGKRIDAWTGNCAPSAVDRGVGYGYSDFFDAKNVSVDTLMQEFSVCGRSDMRPCALELEFEDGTNTAELKYKSHTVTHGKPKIPNLPSIYVLNDDECDTLTLVLCDTVYDLTVTLFYSVFNNRNVITRHVCVANGKTEKSVRIKTLMSAHVDFASDRYTMMQLSGSWGRERRAYMRPLVNGTQSIESRRGSSSHQHNPFVALLENGATEDAGTVYGFNFVYSGNFWAGVDVDFNATARFMMGINPYNFTWNLNAGESFYAPEVVMVYSANGLGEMSRTFHDLYRERLCKGEWQYKERPIVINNWEATYFDFTSEKLCALADKAVDCGIELFVLDDGWFGNRFDDRRSLGDWIVNETKLHGGLKALCENMNKRGLGFGIWVEPEMVSPDSDLFRAHPDWCLHVPNRDPVLARTQLVLDLSRKEAEDYIYNALYDVFNSAPFAYVKWDFNRALCDVASCALPNQKQSEVMHRYVLGLYSLLGRITAAFPHILFESCSSGGGRFDAGMLHYMPQTWTSDNTDCFSRAIIQAGTSVVYPPSAMSCHVSAVPNHQTGRLSSVKQRAVTAMAGTYGYELDLTRLSDEERNEVRAQSELYKKVRAVVQYGDLYRLVSPWEEASRTEAFCSWMTVSKDKKTAVVAIVWLYTEALSQKVMIRLKGLLPHTRYRDTCTNRVYAADELMNFGLCVYSGSEHNGAMQLLLEQVE